MRRVVTFFKWQADDWMQKATKLENSSLTSTIPEPILAAADLKSQEVIRNGKIAYAYRQAGIRERMRNHFCTKWKDLPARLLHMENVDALLRIECH